MGLMRFLSNTISQSMKNGIEELNRSLEEFDFDEEMANLRENMTIMSKRLERKIKKVSKHIHNFYDKWEVDVNFNQDEDIITSQIKDNVISIKVVKETDGSETTFSTTIPDDVIIESMVQKYNPQTHKAIFSFTKTDEVE